MALGFHKEIFDKFPLAVVAGARLPYISHWQNEVYYRGLLQITDTKKLQQLVEFAEAAKPEADMQSLLDENMPEPIDDDQKAIEDDEAPPMDPEVSSL